MKNEQRIWNKSELEAHPEWELIQEINSWEHTEIDWHISSPMIGQSVQWCKDQGYTVTPEMIAKTEQPKTGTEILQKAIKQIDNMTPEEVQQRSKDKGIVIPDEPKTAIAANGTKLVVGGRYRLESWDEGVFAEILFIGEQRIFCKYENENEFSWDINKKWLTYTEPKEEPKPLEGYQKWYVLCEVDNATYIDTIYAKSKEDASKIVIDVKAVYSEQEAIDLGLKL